MNKKVFQTGYPGRKTFLIEEYDKGLFHILELL